MGVYNLAVGSTCEIVSYARVLYLSSHTHTCAYSLERSYIGVQGVQHNAAALAHYSTLQTLK
jgi:hypothetical protein